MDQSQNSEAAQGGTPGAGVFGAHAGDFAGKVVRIVPALTPGKLQEWIAGAQPGAQLCYFTGLFAGHAGDVAGAVLAAAEAEMLHPVQRVRRTAAGARAADGYDYIAIRSSRPAQGGGRARPSLQDQVEAAFARPGMMRRAVGGGADA